MKIDQIFRLILLSTMAFVAAACGTGGNSQTELEGITWTLDEMGPQSNPYPVVPSHRPTLRFNFDDGWVDGQAGCNSYSAKFKVNGDRLSIGDAASTLMGCFPQEVMEQETEFLGLLMNAKSFAVEDGQLTITCSGSQVLVFTRE